jgi:hypothetical protein
VALLEYEVTLKIVMIGLASGGTRLGIWTHYDESVDFPCSTGVF